MYDKKRNAKPRERPACPTLFLLFCLAAFLATSQKAAAFFERSFDLPVPSDPYDPSQGYTFRADHLEKEASIKGRLFYRRGEKKPWWLRVTFPLEGPWQLKIMHDAEVVEETAVVAETSPLPFVRRTEGGRLLNDRGEEVLFKGQNLAWALGSPKQMLQHYREWLNVLAAAGVGVVRIWMAPWGFAPEWKETGLGNYGKREEVLSVLDEVFREALRHRIYIFLVLLDHGQFNTTLPEAHWKENPYNQANGGPCERPRDFFSAPAAKKLFQRRLRFLVARYAALPNLLAWEWWNEVDLTDRYHPKRVLRWLEEMDAILREEDAYHHLRTISFSSNALTGKAIWASDLIDLIPLHVYARGTDRPDFAGKFRRWASQVKDLDKPVFVGEFGVGPEFGPRQMEADPEGRHLREGIVASLAMGHPITAMPWWWDTYIHSRRLYHIYRDED